MSPNLDDMALPPRFWCDIDLDTLETYKTFRPDSLQWALTVNWAGVNDLVRYHLDQYPPDDSRAAIRNATAAGLTHTDIAGLWSLYAEPLWATPLQITAGGHRITAMRTQRLRWALGQCTEDDIGNGVPGIQVYIPD
jgi:hypothetical protein